MRRNLTALSYRLRRHVLDIVMAGRGGHIGGDMSVMDVLVTLYFDQMNISPENQDDPARDMLVLSKGHSVEALYAVLAEKGFFSYEQVLAGFGRIGSAFIGHPNNKLPGIEMNSGSLGHGLSVGVGMALAGRMDGLGNRVYVVMGDGELAEGSVWEGAMAGGHYRLDNLCAIIDCNRLQISGPTEQVMRQDNLCARWTAFGWNALSVNGNSIPALHDALEEAKINKGQPTVIIADTTKGCGSPVMENKAAWHHRIPSAQEYAQIMADLKVREEAALHEQYP